MGRQLTLPINTEDCEQFCSVFITYYLIQLLGCCRSHQIPQSNHFHRALSPPSNLPPSDTHYHPTCVFAPSLLDNHTWGSVASPQLANSSTIIPPRTCRLLPPATTASFQGRPLSIPLDPKADQHWGNCRNARWQIRGYTIG